MHIQTQSFEVAAVSAGNPDSEKLAIVTPGRLDSKDYCHNVSHMNHFADLGYYAVSFDPPGTWESPGSIDMYTTTNVVRAVNELIWFFDQRPTLLFGHSRGGIVSMLVGSSNNVVTHMIAVNSGAGPPSRDYGVIMGKPTKILRDPPPGQSESPEGDRVEFELPYEYYLDGDGYDVRPPLEKCPKPKLFFYGLRDSIVPPNLVMSIFNRSGGQKSICPLDTGHNYRYDAIVIDNINQQISKFLTDTS